ncbi:YkvA family protein [Limnohabitans sp. DM1]|uniref:YkvA family protein n=1 Tax=Limnohabitans sp. DM1 TaxID=1597955 RepID=UPI000A669E37|nr:YkvA family protein [Limnohabitans sp. DM1]
MLWFACRDPRTPLWLKALAIFVVAYALSPIDLVPDFIPVLGFLDDVILLPVLIWLIVRYLPEPIARDGRVQADAWIALHQTKPVSRMGLFLVLVVWALVAWALWRWWGSD